MKNIFLIYLSILSIYYSTAQAIDSQSSASDSAKMNGWIEQVDAIGYKLKLLNAKIENKHYERVLKSKREEMLITPSIYFKNATLVVKDSSIINNPCRGKKDFNLNSYFAFKYDSATGHVFKIKINGLAIETDLDPEFSISIDDFVTTNKVCFDRKTGKETTESITLKNLASVQDAKRENLSLKQRAATQEMQKLLPKETQRTEAATLMSRVQAYSSWLISKTYKRDSSGISTAPAQNGATIGSGRK